MNPNLKYLLLLNLLLLQACTPESRIPACEPNDAVQDEYATSDSNFGVFSTTIRAFNDYEAGIACAQRQNKPIFLAFTGFGARTRYFPDVVIQQEEIVNYLIHDFVPIILYVDDRQKIEKQVIETTEGEITLRTVGNVNAYLQETMFQKQSQPYLVLMTWEGELLTNPMGYLPDPLDYVSAMDTAFLRFNEGKASY